MEGRKQVSDGQKKKGESSSLGGRGKLCVPRRVLEKLWAESVQNKTNGT